MASTTSDNNLCVIFLLLSSVCSQPIFLLPCSFFLAVLLLLFLLSILCSLVILVGRIWCREASRKTPKLVYLLHLEVLVTLVSCPVCPYERMRSWNSPSIVIPTGRSLTAITHLILQMLAAVFLVQVSAALQS